jgi:hypothetical protein
MFPTEWIPFRRSRNTAARDANMRLTKWERARIFNFAKKAAKTGGAALLLLALFSSFFFKPQFTVAADTTLSLIPLTWNVIGLDSNDVTVGPSIFPVGVRVCNTGAEPAVNVVSSFVWDTPDSYIDLRTGSLTEYTVVNGHAIPSLGVGACTSVYADFYYEVEIDRNDLAYNHTRRYHIEVSADNVDGFTFGTPTPREIYVEKLISQNRNSTSDVLLDGDSIPAGGTMTLLVGNTYNITLVGSTATNGYEQIESFINFPNTIFKINTVTT